MSRLSLGKTRGLQQIANAKGVLTICAMDHRDSLRQVLEQSSGGTFTSQDVTDFKLDLCRAVAPFASAILLDPIYGAEQAIRAGALPGHTGLLVSMEKSGYTLEGTLRITKLLPNWGVRDIKKMGASAVKLLIYFRPDLDNVASRQIGLVARVAEECLTEDIPLLLESVTYPTVDEKEDPGEFSRKRPELVIESARRLTALPVDVLKIEFPADVCYEKDEPMLKKYCQELDKASRVPWVLLSAGVGFDLFRKQVEIASLAGASGFLAGRALWQEATQMRSREERIAFFRTTTVQRLREIAEIASRDGRAWHARQGVETPQLALVSESAHHSH